ncbi:MAG: aspartate kinase [Polyangiaceae bacterium]|nr:aspartate kinase [Polyangiaceae bacterium]
MRRPIVVQKYGGSSVADVEKLGRVAERVVHARRAGNDVVVVVSAMGKTTDGLLELARDAVRAGAADGADREPARRELDMLVSTGERVAMSLLSIAIQARGVRAISFTGSQSGIITNDRHFDARIIEVRPHRIEDELARGAVVIVAGYQGMSYKREITTLGRGGSDTTAVALAAALGADRCEIYSDVDGVYSADPRSVPEARHLPELDHALVQEMAESGAKVVCAQAVEWARRAGIAIYARSSFEPVSDTPRQTVIRRFAPGDEPRARAIVGHRQLAHATLGELATLERAEHLLLAAGAAIVEEHVSEERAEWLLSLTSAPGFAQARARIEEELPSLTVTVGLGLVSVVGGGLTERGAALVAFREALAAAAARPRRMLATALRLGAVVDAACVPDAERALHARFVAP